MQARNGLMTLHVSCIGHELAHDYKWTDTGNRESGSIRESDAIVESVIVIAKRLIDRRPHWQPCPRAANCR